MEKQNENTAKKKRRFLMILPLITVPFLLAIFWALGGGGTKTNTPSAKSGINNQLPDAALREDKGMDKMAFYEQAVRDSAKRATLLENDPYHSTQSGMDSSPITMARSPYDPKNPIGPPGYSNPYPENNERKIYERLQQLNQSLSQSEPTSTDYKGSTNEDQNQTLKRLEQMMERMQSGGTSADPETEQLDGMLEKVLDLQYPERAEQKIKASSREHLGRVYAVTAKREAKVSSLLTKQPDKNSNKGNGFYSFDVDQTDTITQNTIEAVVHEAQTIVNGSTVKLRLLDDVYVNGQLIPENTFVFGTAALDGERLLIKISGLRYKKALYPIELSVVDIDGLDGVYIPGAIAREVAKESADRAIQGLSFGSMSNSLSLQAAGTGLEAAKSLFSKKAKLIKVEVKAGYKVLLRDEKQKQDNG